MFKIYNTHLIPFKKFKYILLVFQVESYDIDSVNFILHAKMLKFVASAILEYKVKHGT